MPFGAPYADFGSKQRAHSGTRGCFRSEQVDALCTAPLLVALDSGEHGILHLLPRLAGVEHTTGLSQYIWIVDFKRLLTHRSVWPRLCSCMWFGTVWWPCLVRRA